MFKQVFEKLFNDPAVAVSFNYTLVRSHRKTLCIQVKQGAVRVLAPKRYPDRQIMLFLQQKQAWVSLKLQQQAVQRTATAQVASNTLLLCKGIYKQKILKCAAQFSLIETDQSIELYIPNRISEAQRSAYIKKQLSTWYKRQAQQYLPARLAQLSSQLALRPSTVLIKQYKARWGSCNSQGVISLNSLLMMTPDFVIDYVIVHELCHLQYMNHSRHFWALVSIHYPEVKRAKRWLKDHRIQLQSFHQ